MTVSCFYYTQWPILKVEDCLNLLPYEIHHFCHKLGKNEFNVADLGHPILWHARLMIQLEE